MLYAIYKIRKRAYSLQFSSWRASGTAKADSREQGNTYSSPIGTGAQTRSAQGCGGGGSERGGGGIVGEAQKTGVTDRVCQYYSPFFYTLLLF